MRQRESNRAKGTYTLKGRGNDNSSHRQKRAMEEHSRTAECRITDQVKERERVEALTHYGAQSEAWEGHRKKQAWWGSQPVQCKGE
jgi:hypothetical protein